MSRPRFSIIHIANQNYPNWKLNVESKYEVLHVDISSVDSWFLIADDNKNFVRIKAVDCKLGKIHWNN